MEQENENKTIIIGGVFNILDTFIKRYTPHQVTDDKPEPNGI
jgi:hypothetical protein